MTEDEEIEILMEFARELKESQEELNSEFAKLLDDNWWELLADD